MSKTHALIKPVLAAAAVGLALAGPAWAASSDEGVQTPRSPSAVPSNQPPLHGKPSTNVMPSNRPLSPGEAGDPRPEQDHFRSTPPAGSAMAPNPKTPFSPNESAPTGKGGTSGGTAHGAKGSSGNRYGNDANNTTR